MGTSNLDSLEVNQMRIVFITDWFAEKMGYAENCLPKAMASLGHEVHVITSNVQPYFNSPVYKETYEPFIGPGIVACGVKEIDGYTLHRLPHIMWKGNLRIRGLLAKLRASRPQIVQTFDVLSQTTFEAALGKLLLGYKLFLESHVHASVFPLATGRVGATTVDAKGRVVSLLSEKCYPISADAADIAIRFFGVQPNKVSVCSLGVDTELFRSPTDASSQQVRVELRHRLGFAESDVVCVYTGRFSEDKDPLCLAQAISILVGQDMPFRGLFVGWGPQAEAIQGCQGCVVHPFVPFRDLVQLYWAADIGVWPRQESTSQLDAAACGLPIVLSNRIKVTERVDGNGLTYEEGDPHDLARQVSTLCDPQVRCRMGEHGAKKMREHFSWRHIAEDRTRDYERAWQGR